MIERILILILFLLSLIVRSQELILEKPTASNSLTASTVYSICQSTDGYMFFGTEKGVIKYNGLYYENLHLDTKGKAVHNLISVDDKIYGLTFSKELFIWSKDSVQVFSSKNNLELSKLSWFKIIGNSIYIFSPKSFQILNKNTLHVTFTKRGIIFQLHGMFSKRTNGLKFYSMIFKLNQLMNTKLIQNLSSITIK